MIVQHTGNGYSLGDWHKMKRWSEVELDYLKTYYATADMADLVLGTGGREWQSIQVKASQLGLRRVFLPVKKKFKVCVWCGVIKSRDEYAATSKGGRRGECRRCQGARRWARESTNLVILAGIRGRRPSGRKRYGYHLVTKYGLTLTEYDALIVAQGGCCAICEKPSIKLVVDHNHKTGRVRGLLCGLCNTAIGILENSGWLSQATAYLVTDVPETWRPICVA